MTRRHAAVIRHGYWQRSAIAALNSFRSFRDAGDIRSTAMTRSRLRLALRYRRHARAALARANPAP